MKKAKNVYSRNFTEYRLTNKQLHDVQNRLLNAFLDIKKFCEENCIRYMMSGGSLLGTIRHEGFIPWDDDIDIMMTRNEYMKFSRLFDKYLSDKYFLAEPLKTDNYCYKMPKVYVKNTIFQTIINAGYDFYNMLSIDIFIIEYVPNSKIMQKLKGTIYNLAYKAASVCFDYKYPSPVIIKKAKENKEIHDYYKGRRSLGKFFNYIGGMKFYLKICDVIARSGKPSDWYGVPSAISYNKEILPKRVFDNLGTGIFCGISVSIPIDFDTYLKNLYGDYMRIPDLKNRETHVAYKINL